MFQKDWPIIFQDECRNPDEEESYVDSKLRLNAFGNHLSYFLQDYDEDVPVPDEITRFCQGVHESALYSPGPGQRKGAWLDDRSWSYHSTCAEPQLSTNNGQEPLSSEHRGPTATGNAEPELQATSNLSPQIGTQDDESQDRRRNPSFREYETPLSPAALSLHLRQKVR